MRFRTILLTSFLLAAATTGYSQYTRHVREVGTINLPAEAWDIAIQDDHLYIAARDSGLRIVDISDPENPVEVGAFIAENGEAAELALSVVVERRYAYLAVEAILQDTIIVSGLRIIDIDDPEQPVEVGCLIADQSTEGVAVCDGFAYLVGNQADFRIVDVSDPEHPEQVGSFDLPGAATDLVVAGDYAYVANRNNGVRILNVSNPENPEEVVLFTPSLANISVRVILATDGDFNVGVSSTSELVRTIEEKRQEGIFLTVLGFGTGNLKDHRMEQLADKGNGNYYYIDNIQEARKVLVTEIGATLVAIAKDVKIQVEFNPAKVQAYRLVGYENRMLKKEDFHDDTKDAGEMGAGHSVTALYEIIPAGVKVSLPKVDSLKYQRTVVSSAAFESGELMTVKLRYKLPDKDTSKLLTIPIMDGEFDLTRTSESFKFSAAVAEFGMLLRDSQFKGNSTWDNVLKLAKSARGKDEEGYRSEFIRLVETCIALVK